MKRSFGQRIWLVAIASIGLFGLEVSLARHSKDSAAREDKIRAATVVGIIRYTRWREAVGDELNICLAGEAASFPHLQVLDKSRAAHNKKLNIMVATQDDHPQVGTCHVVVIGPKSPIDINNSAIRKSCLVICDQCSRERGEASVILRKDKNRIRFDVYLDRAARQGVSFRAAMLELAARVEGLGE